MSISDIPYVIIFLVSLSTPLLFITLLENIRIRECPGPPSKRYSVIFHGHLDCLLVHTLFNWFNVRYTS